MLVCTKFYHSRISTELINNVTLLVSVTLVFDYFITVHSYGKYLQITLLLPSLSPLGS